LLGRGIRRRCPRCGTKDLWDSFFKMKDPCPACGLQFERGDSAGHFLGAVMINLVVTEMAFGIVLLAGILLTWPNVPWVTILMVSVAVNATVPIVFYPFSLTIWAAFDLMLFRMHVASLPR
jgi:uncharacterized protein (DUF983 family)